MGIRVVMRPCVLPKDAGGEKGGEREGGRGKEDGYRLAEREAAGAAREHTQRSGLRARRG